MIDTHAHVHDRAYDDDREEMLLRAREAGVRSIVTVGCDVNDSRRALETAGSFGLFATVGVHPHEAKDAPEDLDAAFDALIAAAGVRPVAIGECGLDYHYDNSPREQQRDVFARQIAYARERNLPLVFHQREAFDDFLTVVRRERAPARAVVHCFTGTPEEAERLVGEFGFRLGIGGVLTFKTAEPLREAVRRVGLDALVLETDAPYLAPLPYRGKRNEPAMIVASARRVAEILEIPLETVVAHTDRAATELFGLPAAASNGSA